jgi:hypothetical protein
MSSEDQEYFQEEIWIVYIILAAWMILLASYVR